MIRIIEQQRIMAYLDSFSLTRVLRDRQARLTSHKGMISLREPHKGVILQSATGEELRPFVGRTLLPSVLRPSGGAFKGKLLKMSRPSKSPFRDHTRRKQ